MYLTGFADEVSSNIEDQIRVTKELGWNAIEARSIGESNIHDISDADFENVCKVLLDNGIHINCFGSTIANWSKKISDPFEISLQEVERTISRMHRLNVKLVRIMSYARCPGSEQYAEERFRRLKVICDKFLDAGITPLHENCMNYGGMSWMHTLELINNISGLRLVFDTGNPVISKDYSKTEDRKQDSLEFFKKIHEHVEHIHIKDAFLDGDKECFVFPGEGDAKIVDILKELKHMNYNGGISIEPHMASVFHDPDAGDASFEESYKIYIEYGKRLMGLLENINYRHSPFVSQ
ncbi:MAG: sugar phosphate isomerase/epimerase family protein [Thalassobaculaceae bacterium]